MKLAQNWRHTGRRLTGVCHPWTAVGLRMEGKRFTSGYSRPSDIHGGGPDTGPAGGRGMVRFVHSLEQAGRGSYSEESPCNVGC